MKNKLEAIIILFLLGSIGVAGWSHLSRVEINSHIRRLELEIAYFNGREDAARKFLGEPLRYEKQYTEGLLPCKK